MAIIIFIRHLIPPKSMTKPNKLHQRRPNMSHEAQSSPDCPDVGTVLTEKEEEIYKRGHNTSTKAKNADVVTLHVYRFESDGLSSSD